MNRLLLAFALLSSTLAHAQSSSVVLVELFTSEGCSSCPPADALLEKVAGQHVAGALVIGLSEHVTYWNSLGWRDPWSQELFTQRQNGYGERFQLQSVYTPQMVVDGTKQILGSDAPALRTAVAQSAVPSLQLKIVAIAPQARVAKVSYTLAGEPSGGELFAVVAQDTATSSVLRGENGGRQLTHVAVARNLVTLGKAAASGTVSVPIPEGLQGGRHLVLFVQAPRFGKVLGVDAQAFPAAKALADVP